MQCSQIEQARNLCLLFSYCTSDSYSYVDCASFSSFTSYISSRFLSGVFQNNSSHQQDHNFFFLWVLGTFWFYRTLYELRKEQQPQWYLKIILFYFPHAKEKVTLERSVEATGQGGSCSHWRKVWEIPGAVQIENIGRNIRASFCLCSFCFRRQDN